MEFGDATLFTVIKKRLAWLTRRQEVLAQNIANSDTPDYKPRDLKPFNFKELLGRQARQVNMTMTDKSHLPGRLRRVSDFSTVVDRKPYETAPGGNAVILEEQMAKINLTAISHRLTTELYGKHLDMMKIALGKGR
ncbi:MAG: flagellar basal body rod protein FlgB [Proteobacteria bacterium]|nr:flagellar basal body rod protein FlgB [Pseudomonadota bacterium]